MSEVAGKLAAQVGARILEKPLGGRGVLVGGVPGVSAARVMVVGGGVVGQNAANVLVGMGADVYVFDRDIDRLRELDLLWNGRATTMFSSSATIEALLPEVDLVIGAVLVHGATAPRILMRGHLALMKPGAVLVDVSIDQGGCFETSKATTHSDPTYEIDGVTHYCVANMAGAVPITSTFALTNATLPYVVKLCEEGVKEALASDPGFLKGLVTIAGRLTSEPVARDQGREWDDARTWVASSGR
jgi:alanine dehydrogenase